MGMARSDYPIDLRAAYPERSSRLWAILTIFLIKFLALIPHFFVLFFLGIAQLIVAVVAQVMVAVRGEYPPGMFRFVAQVLRWNTRVSAFVLSLTDRYPPFRLEPDADYPVDGVIERPERSSRLFAVFTLVVEVLFIVGAVFLWRSLSHDLADLGASPSTYQPQSLPQSIGSGLILRQIAALPHLVVLAFIGIGVFLVWLVLQWIILFVASYPRELFGFSAGFVRWQLRVQGYGLGLTDRYPPFTFDPSIAAPVTVPAAWYPDPMGRHQQRYWDGAAWTHHVADDGETSVNPL
jgi:hypothetical protein